MRVNGFKRRAAVIGGCAAAMGAAGTFLVVRLVSQDGGYSDFFFAVGLLAIIFLVGACVELRSVARVGDGVGAAVSLSLAASVVLVVLGVGVGLRG